MSLQLMRCQPDPIALATWATRHGLLSPDGDYGYALHALLTAAFGGQAPKPFCYLEERQGLLAYTNSNLDSLRKLARLAAPAVARVLRLDSLDSRLFPSNWRAGQRLGFEVRVRPVIRTSTGRERDAYLSVLEAAPEKDNAPPREAVYMDWLNRQFQVGDAAKIAYARMDGFRLTRVVRKSRNNAESCRSRNIAGPDVLFRGELQVVDNIAFSRLVARGVGRHRAFGFGMLLLKPARLC
ncbi:MAG: type I-E CRISPR-associated protein Cas6/Cse3/CasE [Candidatus Nitrosoglobus sp.]